MARGDYGPSSPPVTGIRSLVDLLALSQSLPRPDARPGPYRTELNPNEEAAFQAWIKQNNLPFDASPTADYDLRGYFKAMQAGDPRALRTNTTTLPDQWKTPYHRTFSNESIYAGSDAPRWVGNRLIDQTGQVLADETANPRPISLMELTRLKRSI